MATPYFDTDGLNTALTSSAERTVWNAPQARHTLTQMPGVSGAFVSLYGQGARTIVGVGRLEQSSTTLSAAMAAVKEAVRDRQFMIDLLVGTYKDTDGASYENCVLAAYDPQGEVFHSASPVSGSYTAAVNIRFAVIQLDPT